MQDSWILLKERVYIPTQYFTKSEGFVPNYIFKISRGSRYLEKQML